MSMHVMTNSELLWRTKNLLKNKVLEELVLVVFGIQSHKPVIWFAKCHFME